LWSLWDATFARARYISLAHLLTPDAPLWKGFPSGTKFERGSGRLNETSPYAPFTYEANGVETTAYTFVADQFGTQLDPPAHWHQCFPAIDELPPTLALRKLAVISIADKVQVDVNYHLTADDVRSWEAANGAVPAGSVVMVRSDWHKRWPDAARFQPADGRFPGVSLDALKLLHLERKILLHGHEPIDTDSTPTLVGEDWLMNNGYMQAEGVAYALDYIRGTAGPSRSLDDPRQRPLARASDSAGDLHRARHGISRRPGLLHEHWRAHVTGAVLQSLLDARLHSLVASDQWTVQRTVPDSGPTAGLHAHGVVPARHPLATNAT
jgi:kynurenine formamidase